MLALAVAGAVLFFSLRFSQMLGMSQWIDFRLHDWAAACNCEKHALKKAAPSFALG